MRTPEEQTLLERMRRRRGWTQAELARKAGVADSTVRLAEGLLWTRFDPRAQVSLCKLAEALRIRPALLLADFYRRMERK